ncbi:unnamed protein product [Toxocara canis]|uniref:Amino acid transporter n=1 Tax=Toxocara canis TaxID=6265 RepID=A0A183V053_TOXCA|nr:unnamed protein product [Toxocara canis]
MEQHFLEEQINLQQSSWCKGQKPLAHQLSCCPAGPGKYIRYNILLKDLLDYSLPFVTVETGDGGILRLQINVKKKFMSNCSGWTKKNILLLLTVASVFIGVAIGFGLKLVPKLGPAGIETISLLGELFIRMLQMTVLPLVTCSVMIGLATLDPRTSKRVIVLSFAYYALTTTIAVITGVALALAIAPGKRTDWHDPNTREGVSNIAPPLSTQDALFDLFRGRVTGMITISTVCGVFLGRMREKGGMLVRILFVVDQITMKLISLIMWYSPVGIACLIAARLLEVVDLWRALSALGSYMATVISGFLIQMFFVQPLIYMLLTRKNPLTFMKGLLQVWVTAFVTSSRFDSTRIFD